MIMVTVQPRADLLRNWASFACKLPNSNPVLVFFTVCTAECADLLELLLIMSQCGIVVLWCIVLLRLINAEVIAVAE